MRNGKHIYVGTISPKINNLIILFKSKNFKVYKDKELVSKEMFNLLT